MSTGNVRTENLITSNAKPITTEPAKNSDTQKTVLPGRNFIRTPEDALMTLLTEPAVLRPDARATPQPLILLTELTAPTDANTPVITPAIWTARPARRLPIREDAAVRPETDAEQRPVIILMKPAVILIPAKPDVPAELIPALTAAAAPEPVVLPVPTPNRIQSQKHLQETVIQEATKTFLCHQLQPLVTAYSARLRSVVITVAQATQTLQVVVLRCVLHASRNLLQILVPEL